MESRLCPVLFLRTAPASNGPLAVPRSLGTAPAVAPSGGAFAGSAGLLPRQASLAFAQSESPRCEALPTAAMGNEPRSREAYYV